MRKPGASSFSSTSRALTFIVLFILFYFYLFKSYSEINCSYIAVLDAGYGIGSLLLYSVFFYLPLILYKILWKEPTALMLYNLIGIEVGIKFRKVLIPFFFFSVLPQRLSCRAYQTTPAILYSCCQLFFLSFFLFSSYIWPSFLFPYGSGKTIGTTCRKADPRANNTRMYIV